ncbi:IDEAL domain-containing protein [Halalkalibacter akibai]|uniref:IDEAL domain-containing protein n=1 Tax=Halalkalibacter akibai (strain ATCC 43226 / DSM 21942 / CIP 109018 / JCM 9157 / 1139) TaxID=1236973 RepID=W4QZ46_HALA3|nr:hypothetical protein [Halalkalibacter akibai]GAE37405.1 hypothetical protein JCM9157_4682 [Halalkalibacter akibai JCM 9157]
MVTNSKNGLRVGDWIKGKTRNGELIHGYVELIEPFNSLVQVKIIISDNKKLIGRIIKLDDNDLEIEPMTTDLCEGEILNLIDLSLSTKDKQWFLELIWKLKRRQSTISFVKKKK